MNSLLVFFALPIATIILAVVLQRILKCPLLVGATFFAVYLIITYAAFDSSFLVYAIIYTILAYVTAVLTKLICNIINSIQNCPPHGRYTIMERPITVSRPCDGAIVASDNISATNSNSGCNCQRRNRR